MEKLIDLKNAVVRLQRLDSRKTKITVMAKEADTFISASTCETSYPPDLIEKILDIKGPEWLCDEIMRDESQFHIEKNILNDVFPYLSVEDFKNKKILDFGCGSGASTAVLARLLPETIIVGVELQTELVEIAKARADHYCLQGRVDFRISPNGNTLPEGIGDFDFIFLSAVYEHLLPEERMSVMPMLWRHLRRGGILFVTETPFRWFPVEYHTTGGVPFINYMPDRLAMYCARRFSRRMLRNDDWSTLLRAGIRGGSVKEIVRLLSDNSSRPIVMAPRRSGMRDRIDLWYAGLNKSRYALVKKLAFMAFKTIKMTTGISMLPVLSLAIKKDDRVVV